MRTRRYLRILAARGVTMSCATAVATSAARPAQAEDNGVGATPALGWSSWSFVRHNPTEPGIEAQAAAMKSGGLASVGYQDVNVDDFWYQCPGGQGQNVDAYGRWVIDAAKFPSAGGVNGIAATAGYVHSLGLKFGLCVTPGISKQAVAQNTPVEGTSYAADQIAEPSVSEHDYNCGGMVGIDYTKPGAQQFVDSWADEFASWRVDYIKIDGVGPGDIPDVQAWSQALQQTGRPIHLELSNNLSISNAATWQQYSNGWRTGGDLECYGCESGGSSYPLTDWANVASRFNQVAAWQPFGGAGAFNDYDSVEVGNAVISVDQDGIDAARISSTSTAQVAATSTLAGCAVVQACSTCYGGHKVGNVGSGGTVTINNITVPVAGIYNVTLVYCDGSGTGRQADVSADGGAAQLVSFSPTGSFSIVGALTIVAAGPS